MQLKKIDLLYSHCIPSVHLVVLLRHVVEHVEEGLTTELAHMRLASAATHSNRSSGCLWKKTSWSCGSSFGQVSEKIEESNESYV